MWLYFLLLGAGCGLDTDTEDDRPATFAFVTEAILKPTCGTAECHSAMKAEKHDVFDSIAGARTTITVTHSDLVYTCAQLEPPESSPCDDHALDRSYLYRVIDLGDVEGNRMPLDQAMSNKDIALIRAWIRADAPGLY